MADAIEIVPLTPDTRDLFLEFFDGEAFADNPQWAGCYCHFPQAPHPEWDVMDRDHNRAASSDLIAAGEMRGFLAMEEGRPVGWCNANRRSAYTIFETPGSPDAAAIVCFVVAPSHRGRGIASRLLEAACEGMTEDGAASIEAHPRRDAGSQAAANHAGTLAMYLDAGFEVVAEEGGTVFVRRAL